MNNHCNNGEVRYPDPLLYDTVLKIPETEGCKIGKALWRKIKNNFPAEERYEILAPGIGTGRFVIPFLLAIPDEDRHKVQVYAIEKDRDMSSYLRKKLQELKLQGLVDLREVDFEKKVTEDDKKRFHACFAFFIFHHLKDPIKGIDKMVSFLKPNGLFFFSEEQGDKILWDTNFQHVNYKELQDIIEDEARLSFVSSAYSFSRGLARKGIIRYPLISAGDNTATINYLEEEGLSNVWDNNKKKQFSFDQHLKKNEWFATIRKGMFSFLPKSVATEYPNVIDDTEKNLLHSEFTIKNRLRIYAFQAKKPSQAANKTLPVHKRKLLSRRIKQASVLRFAQRIIVGDIYKDDDLFQNELKNRLQVMENHGFFEKSVFVYPASWALHKGTDGDWRQEVPVWISKVNDSDEPEPPWNFIATQFLYLLLSGKDVEPSDFKIVNFVLRDMPDKCILEVEYFDNSPSRWDVNFDRFGKVEKITIPCSKRLVSLLTPFLKDITSTVQYLNLKGISGNIQRTKKGWTISLKKLLDILDGSPFNTEPIRHKMKELSNDAEFKRAITEGKKFFEDISKFTGRKSWKFSKNQLTKFFIALLYTNLVGSFDEQRKWRHLYYIPGATHSEALQHDKKEHSSFCWMMLCDEELLETEERYLRLTANLYGRADSTWSWAKRAAQEAERIGIGKGIVEIASGIAHNLSNIYANYENEPIRQLLRTTTINLSIDQKHALASANLIHSYTGRKCSLLSKLAGMETIPGNSRDIFLVGDLLKCSFNEAYYIAVMQDKFDKTLLQVPPHLVVEYDLAETNLNNEDVTIKIPQVVFESYCFFSGLYYRGVERVEHEIIDARIFDNKVPEPSEPKLRDYGLRISYSGKEEVIRDVFVEIFFNALKYASYLNNTKAVKAKIIFPSQNLGSSQLLKIAFINELSKSDIQRHEMLERGRKRRRGGMVLVSSFAEANNWKCVDNRDHIRNRANKELVDRLTYFLLISDIAFKI